MTTREISERLECIYKRQQGMRIFEASLHDKKLDISSSKEAPAEIELTEEERKVMEINRALALERKQKKNG